MHARWKPPTPMKWFVLVNAVVLALMIAPNCTFYGCSNIMSGLLQERFDSETIVAASYSAISIPSIPSIVVLSVLIDTFSTILLFPLLQALCVFGSFLCFLSDKYSVSYLYLAGRFAYGIAGECTQTAQAKLIAELVPVELQTATFALMFCGYMLGDALGGWIVPVHNSVGQTMLVIGALQIVTLVCSVYYSAVLHKKQKNSNSKSEQSFTVACSKSLRNLINLKPKYYVAALSRVLFYVAKASYDARSVEILSELTSSSTEAAVQMVLLQFYASAASFLLNSFLAFWIKKVHAFILIGDLLLFGSFVLLCVGTRPWCGQVASVSIGIGFGAVAGNISAVLIQLAGKALGATALGLVYSLEYLLLFGMFPLSQFVATTVGERQNVVIYACMAAASLLFEVIASACPSKAKYEDL